MPRYDASQAECLVYAFREGLLSAVGHDVCLEVTRYSDEGGAGDAIAADFDAASLRVTGDVPPADAHKIERNAADDVLAARRFPTITFRSTEVSRQDGRARIAGTLTLHGVTRPLSLVAEDDGSRWRAEVRLDQRQFGIRPFSAMLGALKVKPEILVRVALPRG
jgi:hypothetical protein